MSQSFSLGLIGFPLSHSLSPYIHRAALQAAGLQGDYHLYAVDPEGQGRIKIGRLFDSMRRGEIQGLNVTIPHKQNVISYMDALTPSAQAIGAVNTIFLQNDSLTGDNTDAPAFLTEIHNLEISSSRRQTLVLGAGGSARAVVYALVNDGWQVNVLARKLEQAQEIAAHFGEGVMAYSWNPKNIQELGPICSLIVNTTPMGMSPNPDVSPWPKDLPMPAGVVVYDLVYNPPITKFLQTAREQGLVAHKGGGMLVEQAALAFEQWTGQNPPRDIMRQVLDEQLSLNQSPNVLDSTT